MLLIDGDRVALRKTSSDPLAAARIGGIRWFPGGKNILQSTADMPSLCDSK
jgi:hypothetical protein